MAKKKDEPSHRFELDGEVIEVDVDALTFGEIEGFENYMGCGMGQIDMNSGKALLFIAYIAKHRKDPTVVLDDLRDIRVNTLKDAPAPKRPTKTPETTGSQS